MERRIEIGALQDQQVTCRGAVTIAVVACDMICQLFWGNRTMAHGPEPPDADSTAQSPRINSSAGVITKRQPANFGTVRNRKRAASTAPKTLSKLVHSTETHSTTSQP